MSPALSVIIPVYNEQSYLACCLDTVLGQTLSDIEVLCVDDGSSDASPGILRAYAAKDARVRILSPGKIGVGPARNLGIRHARGEYLAFMDADDHYPGNDCLRTLYEAAVQHGASICGGSFRYGPPKERSAAERSEEESPCAPTKLLAGYVFAQSGFRSFADYQFIFGYQRFLFQRSLLLDHAVYFPPYARFQDPPFLLRAMLAANNFFAVADVVYHNRRGHKKVAWTSVTRNDFLRGFHDCLALAHERRLDKLKALLAKRLINEYLALLSPEASETCRRRLMRLYPLLKNTGLSAAERCKFFLFLGKNGTLARHFPAWLAGRALSGIGARIDSLNICRAIAAPLKQKLRAADEFSLDLYLDLLVEKYRHNPRDIESILADETVTLNDSCHLNSTISHIECLFAGNGKRPLFGERPDKSANTWYTCGIGPGSNTRVMRQARRAGADALIMEDACIRSVLPVSSGKTRDDYVRSIAFTIDDMTAYYDASRPSRLETLLNDASLQLDREQIARARRCMDRIVRTHVSKYNCHPIFPLHIGRPQAKKVLVVDQSFNDQSVLRGMADARSFQTMLYAAVGENPEADIIVKAHPDSLGGKRRGFYAGIDREYAIYPLTAAINPISLLKSVDKVYVCTSQMGFEALLCGKETHVFGMPFYAGWGLTHDRQPCARRTTVRSLEELFYITYIMYSHYVDPETKGRCQLERALEYILMLRDKYFNAYNIRCEF